MTHRVDDPAALEALLLEWAAPSGLHQTLLDYGFATLGSLMFAVPESPPSATDSWISNLLGLDPADPRALLSAEVSCLRRLLATARGMCPPAVRPGEPASAQPLPSSASSAKMTPSEVQGLRKTFMSRYPSELLSPDTTPSLDFLSALKSAHAAGQPVWIPWRLRTSETDVLAWNDSRRPRNDRQLLRHLLESDEDPPGPTAVVPMSGPSEPTVRKALQMFATALGLLQIVHPLTAKRFNERFLQHALAIPSDATLRGPTLQEILSADRAVWQAIHTLSRDHGWSVSDCMNEVAYCRQDIPSALQPRPRAFQPPRMTAPDAAADPPPASAAKRRRKSRNAPKDSAAARPDPKKKSAVVPVPAAQAFDPSWFKQINGVETCMRGALGRCKNPQCKFSHLCPVPLPNGKPCAQKHTALEHNKTKH